MISVLKAKTSLAKCADQLKKNLSIETIPLNEALKRITAQEIFAPLNVPLFDNSAMDGFALRWEETQKSKNDFPLAFKITGETKAGDPPGQLTLPYSCLRIMTGAAIPREANAIVIKENVVEKNGWIHLSEPAKKHQHIRFEAEDIRCGMRALSGGTTLTPGILGFLASLGVNEIPVFRHPRVSVVVTGNELVSHIQDLSPGKILDSNSVFLKNALEEIGLTAKIILAGDDPSSLKKHLERALEHSDLVLTTGGVSVGDYDFTRSLLEEFQVEPLFWKVNQKPGKPFYAGTLNQKLILGLPGNPYAVFACYYIYIHHLLKSLMGHSQQNLTTGLLPLASEFSKKDDKTHFLKGRIICQNNQHFVEPLKGQGSHQLAALVDTQVLITIQEHQQKVLAGENVEVLFL